MCHSHCGNSLPGKAHGLTLVELVVVLAILAVLAGVAVRSLEPIADQARYESSQKTLVNIDEAILFRSVANGASVRYSGFVADVGRLPQAVGASDRWLSELWASSLLPGYSIRNFDDPHTEADETTDDSNPILVAAGWRGPYLQLAPGNDTVHDGYGRPLVCIDASGSPITAAGTEIASVVSVGSNGVISAADTDYRRDLTLPGGHWSTDRLQGAVPVLVTASDGVTPPTLAAGERIVVRIYGPDNGVPAVLSEAELSADIFASTLQDISVGPRVIRAVKVTGVSPSEAIASQSTVRQLMVGPGMNAEINLRLP